MNRTGIEYVDRSWNPITGCLNDCEFPCFARNISRRFVGHFNPEFHLDRLDEPKKVKKPCRIFAGTMTDTFGGWVKEEWILKTFTVMKDTPQHTYLVLTKCPQNINRFIDPLIMAVGFPANVWVGTSVERQAYVGRISHLQKSHVPYRVVSFEPLLEEVEPDLKGIDWVIIGGQTNPTRIPKKEWVVRIILRARALGIPVFIKDNCGWPEEVREFPAWYGAV